jgi:6-phosphogluconolactonase
LSVATKGERSLRVFDDLGALLAAAREELVARAQKALRARRRFTLALSGGSTPRKLYESLVGAEIDWSRCQVFFGDERCVPPEHADSNYRMAREALLSRIAIPEKNVHRVKSEDADPERAAKAYEQDLQGFFKLRPGELPTFDLCLMGMGQDGHTASLFPGTTALAEEVRLAVAPYVEKLGVWRVTLTAPVFNHARCVLFLVAGEEKAEALEGVLESERPADELPAKLIKPTAGELLWWVDKAAAKLLTRT